MNKSGFGIDSPVELFSVAVRGSAPGRATFSVGPGSGVLGLTADFIVAPKEGGEPLVGGVYDAARAQLDVVESNTCIPRPTISSLALSGGRNRATITFTPCVGVNHLVEFRDQLERGAWQSLPGGPHNSGTVSDTNSVGTRFYRVRVNP